jgi:hypothetical protein
VTQAQPDEEVLIPFGISARTGRPLTGLTDEAVVVVFDREPEPSPESIAQSERSGPGGLAFAVEGGIDSSDLSQAGWGVMFAPGVDQKIKEALQPLLDHRNGQGASPFVIYDGPTTYRPGDTASTWLERRGTRLDVVDPGKGVPFYLLLVGSPEAIPFTFQYGLDLYWAVGRLWLSSPNEFRQYAESVIAYETASGVQTTRQVAMFAPEHDFDPVTQLFNRQVATPMVEGEGDKPVPVGKRQRFQMRDFLGEKASKNTLSSILAGSTSGGPPALLFSGSHGMEFERDDSRQAEGQGALVCQDWPGFGAIAKEHWFAASDLSPSAKVHGLIHVLFACYGGGCPSHDDFDRLNAAPRQIADRPFFSRLPQAMLSHQGGGALAVLAHIERAWAYSFQGSKGGSQIQGFRDVIGRLLRGERIGQATDTFNIRWSVLSTTLSDLQIEKQNGADVSLKALGRLWVARDDARNFMVLGDPAVRLRVEDMPELT